MALPSLPLKTNVLFCSLLFRHGGIIDKTMVLVASLHEMEQYCELQTVLPKGESARIMVKHTMLPFHTFI
jgi:hypothetical protein